MPPSTAKTLLTWLRDPSDWGTPDPAELTAAQWDALLAEAYRLRLAPLLHRRLLAAAASRPVPPGVLQCIWLAAARQRADAARLQCELPAVLGCLRAEGITPILLKGAHLATTVYAEPALRPMSDFDLLVRAAELATAERALHAAGYTSERADSIADSCTDAHHLYPLVQEGKYTIELHWTLTPPAFGIRVDLDGVWSRAQSVCIGDEAALVLAPEDALLHVCLHAVLLHLFEHGLRPLLDVAALLDRYGATLDWAAVVARARAWGIERAVALVLDVARREAGAAVPDHVLQQLQPGGVPATVVQTARAMLFELPAGSVDGVSTRSLATAWLQPRYLWQTVFRARTSLGPQYATRSAWLYVVRRVQDLVCRYGGLAWRLLRQDRSLLAAMRQDVHRKMMLEEWLGRVNP